MKINPKEINFCGAYYADLLIAWRLRDESKEGLHRKLISVGLTTQYLSDLRDDFFFFALYVLQSRKHVFKNVKHPQQAQNLRWTHKM